MEQLLNRSTFSALKGLFWNTTLVPSVPACIITGKSIFQLWVWFQCVLCICSEEMNRGLILKFENLLQLRGTCRQLRTLSYRKVSRAQWKPVQSSAHPVGSVLLYPHFWQEDKSISIALSQRRHLATKEVTNNIQWSLGLCGKYKSSVWRFKLQKEELY